MTELRVMVMIRGEVRMATALAAKCLQNELERDGKWRHMPRNPSGKWRKRMERAVRSKA